MLLDFVNDFAIENTSTLFTNFTLHMKPAFVLIAFVAILPYALFSQAPDTTFVQTFTYSDPSPQGFSAPYRGTFSFPDTSEHFEKILMYYTLKCDPATAQDNFPCGEWDYLTYTYVVDSTAWYDSTYQTTPNFSVSGTTPDSFPFSFSPTHEIIHDWQKFAVPTDTTSIAQTLVGTGTLMSSDPVSAGATLGRSQYLWRANELTTAGMTAGDISGIQLDIASLGSELRRFQIRMKHTSFDSLSVDQVEEGGFQEVYRLNTTFSATGFQSLLFTQPFNWDGSSNIVVEFTHENLIVGTNSQVLSDANSWSSGVYTGGDEYYLSFNGPDYVEVDAAPLAAMIHDEVTISFWQYGDPAIQPQGDFVFEARNSADLRILSSHLPWGNSQVYWDAGNEGAGYDRINKLANAADFEGQWNHWAYTKDTTSGEMHIYLNGQLWHSGTGKNISMSGIASFSIGANSTVDHTGNYDGFIDEFRIWNKALDQTTINSWMNRDLNNTHPDYANLVAYYQFNEGNGLIPVDGSQNSVSAVMAGVPDWRSPRSTELFRNWEATNIRPNIVFDQSVYISTVDSTLYKDSLSISSTSVIIYGNDGNNRLFFEGASDHPTVPTDTLEVWSTNGFDYIYDASGNLIDSSIHQIDSIIYRNDHEYYSNIVWYEIGRYITPYGIGLDLGPEGTRWIFDVTDYAPLLHDNVYLQAGNNQELLDLEFVMIKGKPARPVKKIENLWRGSWSYHSLFHDVNAQRVDKLLDPTASSYKIKMRISGHGFGGNGTANCAEFCPRNHFLYLNGIQAFDWFVWKECASNFVYPQGGTWVYDRAGWCPGDIVDTYEFDLDGWANPGDSIEIDYAVQDYAPYNAGGNFVLAGQLVTYEAPSYSVDAAIEEILAPNNDKRFSRRNPICNNPRIRIKNNGTTLLTKLYFTYGVEGGSANCYYVWEGNLGFLESADIDLPLFNWTGLDPNDPKFFVEVQTPGFTDENLNNNRLEVPFDIPIQIQNGLILKVRTNSAAHENSYFIYDADGNAVLSRTFLQDNTTYYDTLNLPEGCYTFHLLDEDAPPDYFGNDGIAWWANNDGNGHIYLLNPDGSLNKFWDPDFGRDVYEQFTVLYDLGETYYPELACDSLPTDTTTAIHSEILPPEGLMRIFPNPTPGAFTLQVDLDQPEDVQYQVFNILGKKIHEGHRSRVLQENILLDLSLTPGVYIVKIKTNRYSVSESLIVQ